MKVLFIGAHQDDCEFRCGALARKYVEMGYEVRFLSLCNGCGGHHILNPKEVSQRRAKESARVAEILGITYDIWSDIDDCNLVADLENRKRLIRYIRLFNPDLIMCHRNNDYHADHRAAALLVQDASYLLTVPNECPDVPAMRFMPVIMHYADYFKNPEFRCDVIIDTDKEVDLKLEIAHTNESQVYEWLPFTYGEEVPEGEAERRKWLKGDIDFDTPDEVVLEGHRGWGFSYAKPAAVFRKELIKRYGEERGSKVRYAEAFEISEYGAPLTEELYDKLFCF